MPTEAEFQKWYAGYAAELGLAPNPDDPQHFYDYRAAYRAGAVPDRSGHWPSQFKQSGHPRMIIGGVNTKTGRKVMPKKSKRKALAKAMEYGSRPALKRTRAGLYELSKRRKRAAIDAMTTPGYKRRSVTPLTPGQKRSQGAAALREKLTPPSALDRLTGALTGKKKK